MRDVGRRDAGSQAGGTCASRVRLQLAAPGYTGGGWRCKEAAAPSFPCSRPTLEPSGRDNKRIFANLNFNNTRTTVKTCSFP